MFYKVKDSHLLAKFYFRWIKAHGAEGNISLGMAIIKYRFLRKPIVYFFENWRNDLIHSDVCFCLNFVFCQQFWTHSSTLFGSFIF